MLQRKIAIKRLTASDLTFFEWHFINRNAGNQKAINLNADVFIGQLYPILPELAADRQGRFPVDLFLYGPGLGSAVNLQRKILKGGAYKNWRLDGEFIYNPVEEPVRFNVLVPEDIALMEFQGAVFPEVVTLLLVSSQTLADQPLHAALSGLLGTASMIAPEPPELEAILRPLNLDEAHPARGLIIDERDLEDAAQKGILGTRTLRKHAAGRPVTRSQLEQALQRAERIGLLGEECVRAYLGALCDRRELASYDWVAEENAVAPYDFKITNPDGTSRSMEVKSTNGEFARPIHISLAELEEMRTSVDPYDLVRVYELSEVTGKLRIAHDVRGLAERILGALRELPEAVTVDSISVLPTALGFAEEILVRVQGE